MPDGGTAFACGLPADHEHDGDGTYAYEREAEVADKDSLA